jgi:raffinose/stachyose/melibiose transport system substrate-binding protein
MFLRKVSFLFVVMAFFSTSFVVATGGRDKSDGAVHLEFFQQKAEAVQIVDAIIAEFEAVNPGIKVEQVNVPDSDSILKNRVAANDAPDIFSGWFNPEGFLLIDEGYVKDLTGLPVMDKVEKQYRDTMLYHEKSWMVPISIWFSGVYYNKDIFARQGITTLPTTLAEFYALCDKLKGAGIQAIEVSDKDPHTISQSTNNFAANMFDATKYMDIVSGKINSVADIPGFSTYADFLKRSRQDWAQKDFLGTGYEQSLGDFANEKGAMVFQGNWIIPVLRKANPNFNFGIFPIPAAKAEDTMVLWGNDYSIMLRKNPKSAAHEEAAMKFLEFFAGRGAQIWADMDGSISCIADVKSGLPEYQPVTDLIKAGHGASIGFPDAWPVGLFQDYFIVLQEYLSTFDGNALVTGLDEAFKSYRSN